MIIDNINHHKLRKHLARMIANDWHCPLMDALLALQRQQPHFTVKDIQKCITEWLSHTVLPELEIRVFAKVRIMDDDDEDDIESSDEQEKQLNTNPYYVAMASYLAGAERIANKLSRAPSDRRDLTTAINAWALGHQADASRFLYRRFVQYCAEYYREEVERLESPVTISQDVARDRKTLREVTQGIFDECQNKNLRIPSIAEMVSILIHQVWSGELSLRMSIVKDTIIKWKKNTPPPYTKKQHEEKEQYNKKLSIKLLEYLYAIDYSPTGYTSVLAYDDSASVDDLADTQDVINKVISKVSLRCTHCDCTGNGVLDVHERAITIAIMSECYSERALLGHLGINERTLHKLQQSAAKKIGRCEIKFTNSQKNPISANTNTVTHPRPNLHIVE